MGHVYLIGEIGKEGRYKIGSTKAKNVNKRLKEFGNIVGEFNHPLQ